LVGKNHRGLKDLKGCLLPDTKLTKNIRQQIIRCNLAGNLTKVVQGPPDIHGQKIIGNLIVQACEYIEQGLTGFDQGIVVADIGDDGIAGAEFVQVDQFHDLFFEEGEVFF
jgi:hypothetical protein